MLDKMHSFHLFMFWRYLEILPVWRKFCKKNWIITWVCLHSKRSFLIVGSSCSKPNQPNLVIFLWFCHQTPLLWKLYLGLCFLVSRIFPIRSFLAIWFGGLSEVAGLQMQILASKDWSSLKNHLTLFQFLDPKIPEIIKSCWTIS